VSYTHPTAEEIVARRAQLAPFDGWNERALCQIVAWMGIPASYLDLGSGTGAMVNAARKLGSEAYGVDVINGPEHWFIAHDLTQPLFMVDTRFDLITCLEVAEHLPLDSHETLCDTIARHLRHKPSMDASSGLLLFSAAPPGQRGEHHVGCRPAHEWRGLFHERGISYREDLTRQLAHLFGYVTGPASHWLAANLAVYDRGTV
jgi:SAM-dependent methyltransferase